MQIESVRVQRLRSISDTSLYSCGGFNVLIGKNNAGKSNILGAIDAFFKCIHGGNLVNLNPPFGREIDYHQKRLDKPIRITLRFVLAPEERDTIVKTIVNDAPQMRNALDGLDPTLRLSITVTITPPSPRSYSFVSNIAFVCAREDEAQLPVEVRTLLHMEQQAAEELFSHVSRYQQLVNDAQALSNMDVGYLRAMLARSESRSSSDLPLYMLRRAGGAGATEMSIETFEMIRNVMATRQSSESVEPDAIQEDFARFAEELRDEARTIQRKPLHNTLETFTGEESAVPAYIQSIVGKAADLNSLYLTERRKQIGREEAERLLELKVTRGGPQVLSAIQQTVSTLLGVHVDAFQTAASDRRRSQEAEMDVNDFLVEVNGSGIREALRVVLDVQFKKPDILLIEEPEVHLHPALETGVMRFLQSLSRDRQIFISTHSTNFLDTGEMKNVYLVTKADSTAVRLLDREEAESIIPRELGIRLSSLFMYDKLIFVEGPSDEDVFREWAALLEVNFGLLNVGFVHMGGVRNFAYFAAESTISFLAKRQVAMWLIIDRDERSDEEIHKLRALTGDGARLDVLQKRELENYLLCPRALVEFIKMKIASSGSESDQPLPTSSELGQVIDEVAEELKALTIAKHAAKVAFCPTYPAMKALFADSENPPSAVAVKHELNRIIEAYQAARDGAEQLYDEQETLIEREWASHKLDLVPGDLLLDRVCQRYGVRFRKSQDSGRLAGLMQEHEIPAEVRRILTSIRG